mmetsp:Transcript_24844/g.86513  ORF Transcript_24844/g.86513 Transcript_24844/m.86513 type:complete len:267 (+) Transcript_24844:924-1724(+)
MRNSRYSCTSVVEMSRKPPRNSSTWSGSSSSRRLFAVKISMACSGTFFSTQSAYTMISSWCDSSLRYEMVSATPSLPSSTTSPLPSSFHTCSASRGWFADLYSSASTLYSLFFCKNALASSRCTWLGAAASASSRSSWRCITYSFSSAVSIAIASSGLASGSARRLRQSSMNGIISRVDSLTACLGFATDDRTDRSVVLVTSRNDGIATSPSSVAATRPRPAAAPPLPPAAAPPAPPAAPPPLPPSPSSSPPCTPVSPSSAHGASL